ncbi:Retrotransposon gag protein [Rhizoctonia solani]|uniref:Retrotransposon gag protein n=1 Tax=Rhizoctonia solani TaxID=456999 RepID=A0A8H7IME7_9AGAM|nr:Retrotransposon gag protein [Rhizoctonia solani]
MATCSRPPSQARSPVNQGQLEPFLLPTSPELGKVSLKQVINLLWDSKAKLTALSRPSWNKPKLVKRGPQTQPPILLQPLSLLVFPFRTGSSSPHGPPAIPAAPATAPQATLALPPARSTVKVDHPDAFKGKIGLEAKQWLTRMLAWVCLNQGQFPLDLETLSFLLMNMTEAAGAWAHPHLDQLGSHRALIQTVDEFKTKFLAAFGNPDATQAAEQKITSLTQTSTWAKYITKFHMLQMELDWNDAALRGQFAQGLHWEVQKQIATRERQPHTLRELQDAALIIDNALCEERASHLPQGKRNCCRAEGLCVKCSKPGHKFAKCWTGWKATPKEDEGKAKETAKIGKDSKYQLGRE